MTVVKNKFETFRDWITSQGQSDLWISDEVVTEVIRHNPKGRFKDYLKALKALSEGYEVVEPVCGLPPEPTVTQPNASDDSLGENTMINKNEIQQVNVSAQCDSPEELKLGEILCDIEKAVGGEKELDRMLNAFEAQTALQAMISKGNRLDRSAALVVSKSTNWASRNPKTAVAVGVATVAAAGVGVYHLAKIAKAYI